MSRNLVPSRFPGLNGTDDIAWVIKQQPVMVTVYRRDGGSRGDGTDVVISTFEGRIDFWRNRQREWQANEATYSTEINYLLTTYFAVDRFGNTVSFEPDDRLLANDLTYIIGAKFTQPNIKQEAVLTLIQAQ